MNQAQKELIRRLAADFGVTLTAYAATWLRSVGQTYLFLFVVALIGVSAASLYTDASTNEKTYVVFMVSLSLIYTLRILAEVARLANRRFAAVSPCRQAHSTASIYLIAISILVALSMIAPIVLFEWQSINWAVKLCSYLFFASLALACMSSFIISAVSGTRIRLAEFAESLPSTPQVPFLLGNQHR